MIKYKSIAHINIVVDDIEQATAFYSESLGAIPVQHFPNFKNIGFSKSAGFMDKPEGVDVSIRFIQIPTQPSPLFIELMEYHSPKGSDKRPTGNTNDIGGIRHVALSVENIDETFEHLQKVDGVRMISDHKDYKPFTISKISESDFYFFDKSLEQNSEEKEKVCKIVSNIRYFYFQDPYGVQWEIEQGHDDIASD